MVLKVSLNTGINRIRLEFKENHRGYHFGMDSGINRIRLEFKVTDMSDKYSVRLKVLIESDWNLKKSVDAALTVMLPVLIESDWNLKF